MDDPEGAEKETIRVMAAASNTAKGETGITVK